MKHKKKTQNEVSGSSFEGGSWGGSNAGHGRVTHKRAIREYGLKRHSSGAPVVLGNFNSHCKRMAEDHAYAYALLGMLSDSEMRELVELWANKVSGRAAMMAHFEPNAGHKEIASSGAKKICDDFERHLKKRGDRFKLAMNMIGSVLQFGYLDIDLKWLYTDTLGYFHIECPDLLGS